MPTVWAILAVGNGAGRDMILERRGDEADRVRRAVTERGLSSCTRPFIEWMQPRISPAADTAGQYSSSSPLFRLDDIDPGLKMLYESGSASPLYRPTIMHYKDNRGPRRLSLFGRVTPHDQQGQKRGFHHRHNRRDLQSLLRAHD